MYKLKKGWTKKKIKELIRKHNNGKVAYNSGENRCEYLTNDGNRCAVGCFIPTSYLRENSDEINGVGLARDLLDTFPELTKHMPLSAYGLDKMQTIHDDLRLLDQENLDVRKELCRWIDQNVREK